MPLSITRRLRQPPTAPARWPRAPKILVAIASPPGYAPVPELAHVMEIRRAVEMWVERSANGSNVHKLVTVLSSATCEDIKNACASGRYTHVHILAHGDSIPEPAGARYGLVLHSQDRLGHEMVSGKALAAALRAHYKDGSGISSPVVVTVAGCDTGQVGSVVQPGASLAHDLHEAGIPFVVASQFPLTFAGSTLMARVLYDRLLRGHDPRVVLHDLRQQLRQHGDQIHDWASIVAYAAFPPDLDEQLRWTRIDRAKRAASIILAQTARGVAPSVPDQLEVAMNALAEALPAGNDPASRAVKGEIHGLRGSIRKRQALMEPATQQHEPSESPRLRESQHEYWLGLRSDVGNHWLATQYLALSLLLDDKLPAGVLSAARLSAEMELESCDPGVVAWAHGSLLELQLLRALLAGKRELPDKDAAAMGRAARHARKLVKLMGVDSEHADSTRWQLRRYALWYPKALLGGRIDALLTILDGK
jgi:hypothetical protein